MNHCRSLEPARAKPTFVSNVRPPSVVVVLASLLAALASALGADPQTNLQDTNSLRIAPRPESHTIVIAPPSPVYSIYASLEHHLQMLQKYNAANDGTHDAAVSALPFSSGNDAVATTAATPASGRTRRLHAGGLWSHMLDRVHEAQSRVFRVHPHALRERLSSNASDNEDVLGALNISRTDLLIPWTSFNASSLNIPTVPRDSHLGSRATPTPSHSAQQNRESEPSSTPILSAQTKSTQESGSSNIAAASTSSASASTASSTSSTLSTSSSLPLFLSPPLSRPPPTPFASVSPLDLQPLMLQGVTPTPKPPVTPLPPDVLGNHSVYLVGEKCFGIVKLTGTPLRCTPTFVCDYPLCACGFEIIANGAGVIFSMGPMTCLCECVWSVAFIISVMVLPSMLLVFGTIMCCCTNKRCPFHREFLDMRRVLCPWWKIVEENKMRDTLGVDEFVVSAEDTSDVMMANLPAGKSMKTPLEIARAEIVARQTAKLKELQRQREAERNAYLLPGETAASRPSDSRGGLGSAGGGGGGSRPFTRDGVFARPSALWLRPGSSMAAADGDRYQIRPGTREAGRPNTQGSGRAGYATREEYVAAELAFLSGGSGNSSSDTGCGFESMGSTSQLDFRREMLRQGMSTEEYEEFSNEVDEALRAATDISEAEYDKIFSGPSSSALESDDFLDHAVTHAPHRYSSSSASASADGVPSSSWEDAAAELELASSRRRQDKLAVALQKQANRDSFSAGTIGGSRGTAVKFDSTPSEFYFDSSYGGDNGLGADSMGNSRPGSTLSLSRGGTPGFGTPGFGTPASGASRPIRSSLKPGSSGGGVARQPSNSRSLRDIEMAMRSVNSFGEDIEEEDEDENEEDDGGDSISPARRYQPGKR